MAIEPIKGFYVHDEVTGEDGVAKVSIDAVHEFIEDVSGTVENWLDEHPEATTTVLPDSLTTEKYKDESVTLAKIKKGDLGCVFPEMFGAKGDGETDDTAAWQSAVGSGFNVCAISKKYKCGTIYVTENISIDCNNAEFVCTSEYLFRPSGNVFETLTGQNDYAANQTNYEITSETYSNYSGYGMVCGTNNWNPLRTYYMAGMVGNFTNGVFSDRIPVDCTGVSILLINPIVCNIKKIRNVVFLNTHDGKIIYCSYGVNCRFESIKTDNECYHIVGFYRCYNCLATDIYALLPMYTGGMAYTYPIACLDTCYTKTTNSYIYNPFWHAWTTGLTYICLNNSIDNCEFYSENQAAIEDHDNAIGTIVTNTTTSCMGLQQGCYVNNVKIVSRKAQYKNCTLEIGASPIKELATYNINNIIFEPDATISGALYGLRLISYAQTTGNTVYYNEVNLKNIYNAVKADDGLQISGIDTTNTNPFDSIIVNKITVDNINMRLRLNQGTDEKFNFANADILIKNCNAKPNCKTETHEGIVIDSPSDGSVTIENSVVYWITGGIPNNLTLSNVKMPDGINTNFGAKNRFIGNNLHLTGNIYSYANFNKVLLANVILRDTNVYSVIWRTDSTTPVYAQKVNGQTTPTTITLAT